MNTNILSKWSKEILRFMSVKPQFILWENIYDIYPIELNSNITTLKLTDYLQVLLKENGYNLIISYEPLDGFFLLDGSADTFKDVTGESLKNNNVQAGVASILSGGLITTGLVVGGALIAGAIAKSQINSSLHSEELRNKNTKCLSEYFNNLLSQVKTSIMYLVDDKLHVFHNNSEKFKSNSEIHANSSN